MKLLRLFLAFLLFDSARAAVPFVQGQKRHVKTMRSALSIRGGDLGQIKSKTLAQILSGLAAGDAACCILAPVSSMKWFGVDVERGSLSEHYLHGIGASAATAAISTYLATSGTTPVEEAIGFGFVARLVSMTIMIITNNYHELGMNNAMFGAMWAILAATTYALFSGKWEPMALTQLVSLLLGFHGAFLYLKPEKFIKRTTGKKGDEGKTDCHSEPCGNVLLTMFAAILLRIFGQTHGQYRRGLHGGECIDHWSPCQRDESTQGGWLRCSRFHASGRQAHGCGNGGYFWN